MYLTALTVPLGLSIGKDCALRRLVTGSAPLPRNWLIFLWDDENKKELLYFLSVKISHQCSQGIGLGSYGHTWRTGHVCSISKWCSPIGAMQP